MIDRLLLKPGEAAESLGVSRALIYRLINDGVIPSIRLGTRGGIRVPVDALRAWVAKQAEAVGRVTDEI